MSVKDIVTLIGVHLITIDKEVNTKEVEVFMNYNTSWENISKEIERIVEGEVEKIELDTLLDKTNNFSLDEVHNAYEFFLKLVYADGYYHEAERGLLEKIREKLIINDAAFNGIEQNVSCDLTLYNEKDGSWSDELKIGYYDLMSKLSPKKQEYQKKKQELLLNGPKFVSKIKEIAEVAQYDLNFSSAKIQESSERMAVLLTNLEKRLKVIQVSKRKDQELEEFVGSLNATVKDNAVRSLEENLKVLNKKRKSLNYFTIAFLGRTKAGKSTLHATITKEGDEGIGTGRIRTTRLNKVYNWENLRIIDTPGIGAPGGQTDTEIAESVVDECDLICYVVTNDAIQETEFKFLGELKKKNKPVIILLNVKENISDERRLERFLKNPKKWLERTDHKAIQGHLDRINEYMEAYYDNCYYRVYPVMLLAAHLSNQETNKKKAKLLFEGSNIDSFLTGIKETVFKYGHLRKSQNIIDGSNYQFYTIGQEINAQLTLLDEIIERLKSDKKSFNSYLKKTTSKFEENLLSEVERSFIPINKFARDFAINNWSLGKKELTVEWERQFKKRDFLTKIERALKEEFENIQADIEGKLKEYKEGYQIFYNRLLLTVETSSVFNSKRTLSLSSAVLGLSLGIATFFTGGAIIPILTGVSLVISVVSGFLSSKEEKKRKAQKKIEESLLKGLKTQKEEYRKTTIADLKRLIEEYTREVNANLNSLIEEASRIRETLKAEHASNEYSIDLLNRAIMTRTFQKTISGFPIQNNISQVMENEALKKKKTIEYLDRDFFKNRIELQTQLKISAQEKLEICELMQSELILK